MQEDVKQRLMVARRAVVDVYLAGANGRFFWPHRLQPYPDSQPTVRRRSMKYILDSGFSDPSVTNQDIIERAHELAPEFVIPKDVIRYEEGVDQREAIEQTAASVHEFLSMVDESALPSKVLIPLQPPYDFHLAFLDRHYPDQFERAHFALGGLKDETPAEQLIHIHRFREIAGYDAYGHGFGLGVSRLLIEALRTYPELLDSLDASTIQHHARSGSYAGKSRKQIFVGYTGGGETSTTLGSQMAAQLSDITRMLAPSLTDAEDLKIDAEAFPEAARKASIPGPRDPLDVAYERAEGASTDDVSDDTLTAEQAPLDSFQS